MELELTQPQINALQLMADHKEATTGRENGIVNGVPTVHAYTIFKLKRLGLAKQISYVPDRVTITPAGYEALNECELNEGSK